jgi:hypothetical protein
VLKRHRMIPFIALLITSLVPAVPCLSDDDHNRDELTSQQLGAVRFPISCDARVQKAFERGVALLHSFAFETAQNAFQ